MMSYTLWPYGKCKVCHKRNECADSKVAINACISNEYVDFVPQTNYDSIRSKSIEEMAHFLNQIEVVAIRRAGRFLTESEIKMAQSDRLKWLQQEVKS